MYGYSRKRHFIHLPSPMTSVLRAQPEGSGSRKCYADTSLSRPRVGERKGEASLELKVVLGELSVARGSFQEGRCPLEVWKYSVQTPCTQVCVSLAFGMPVLS